MRLGLKKQKKVKKQKKAEGVGVEPTGDDTSRLPTVLKTARATGPYPLPG